MKVFISWSGKRSRELANKLRTWIPDVIQGVDTWVSDEDLSVGRRWNADLASALEECKFGIVCLTPENLDKTWVHFEAGALSKTVDPDTHLCPYLLGLEKREVQPPLSQFQMATTSKDETWKLLQSINTCSGEASLGGDRLKRGFERCWPELEQEVERLVDAGLPTGQDMPPARTQEDLLEEILTIVRRTERGQRNRPLAGPRMPLVEALRSDPGWILRSIRPENVEELEADLANRIEARDTMLMGPTPDMLLPTALNRGIDRDTVVLDSWRTKVRLHRSEGETDQAPDPQ